MYKRFYSFSEALKTAREHFGVNTFFIEPEKVQTFSEVAKTNPEQVIKAQAKEIAKLQEQLLNYGKDIQLIQLQIENSLLKQKTAILEAKNKQLVCKLEK